MRESLVTLVVSGIVLTSLGCHAQQAALDIAPEQLIREVVYNEMHDHQGHGYWRYWIDRHSTAGETVEEQVETPAGPVTMVEEGNGQPLSPLAIEQERQKMHQLLSSPQEQASHLRQYRQDEGRIGRIVVLLPDAFLFNYDGMENGCYRLRFHPNPEYSARTVEARVLHAMTGTIWVDANYKRLARLDGVIDHNVDFGYGLLGRLYKGGWFQLARVRVSATDWKTEHLEVHMNIRALLVTNIARETSERRGGFTPVPLGLSLEEGVRLIERTEPLVPAGNASMASVAFGFAKR